MPEHWALPYRPRRRSTSTQVFGRAAPLILEIGFGMGETTARIAAAHPGAATYLGIEVHTAGRRQPAASWIAEQGSRNLRIIQHDAVEVLRDMIRPDALAGVHIFFPDPWPKKRHHKRRLIQPPFVALLAARLAPGGYLHCATDWEDYAEQMLDVLSRRAAAGQQRRQHGNRGDRGAMPRLRAAPG